DPMIRTFRAIPALVILLGLPVLARAQPSPPPDPSDVLGAPLGARFTDVAGVERYFEALAGASDRVSLDRYGTTPEGRPLLQVLVAHPRHRARLDAILRANLELADPVTNAERAAEIAATNPVLV